MKKALCILLAALMVLSLAACGRQQAPEAEQKTFIMGIDPEYPPFSYLGDDGEYTGFDVEIAKAACEIAGLEYDVFAVNWDNKLIQLSNHECDVIWSGMTILDSMTKEGYVISAPYYDNTQVLVVRKDSGITSSADLAGKLVAVQLGTSGETLLNEDLSDLKDTFGELVTSESFLLAFTELEGNAVDAVFVDLPVASACVSTRENLVILDEVLGAEQYGLAFRKGEEALCATIEAAVQTLVENGTYAEIAAKYGIRVYTIGVGTQGYAPYPTTDIWGRKVYEQVKVDIDEATLQKIAKITDGQYFRATDNQALKNVYKKIDELEKTKMLSMTISHSEDLFHPFLLWALILMLLNVLIRMTVGAVLP